MDIKGNLNLLQGGSITNLRIHQLAVDPVAPFESQLWVNTAENKIKAYLKGVVVSLATGGNADSILQELELVETAVGLNADGSFSAPAAAYYVATATSIKNAIELLDTQSKAFADAISAIEGVNGTQATAITGLQTEVDRVETSVGLNTDGSLPAFAGDYTVGATSVVDAIDQIDDQVKVVTDLANTKVAKAGDSMTGNLAFGGVATIIGLTEPQNAGDAATKNYVDNISVGLTWLNPVIAVTADHTGVAEAITGDRVANTTDNKIYAKTEAGWDAGVALRDGDAFFDASNETGFVFSGTEIVQFTGGGQIVAGVGLAKAGNTINVNLGAGIAQLPSDEVGIDVRADSGLILTENGVDSSTGTAAQLAVKLGAGLTVGVAGVAVAPQGIVESMLNASVVGKGLAGANGAALSVVADTGIAVTAAGVALDLTYADGRFANRVTTETALSDLGTEVDTVNTRVTNSYFEYDGTSTSAVKHTVVHNLGKKYPLVQVVDDADNVILPDGIKFVDANTLEVSFLAATVCRVIVEAPKA